MSLLAKHRWIRKVSTIAALVANEQYEESIGRFSGRVEMSTSAAGEHFHFLQKEWGQSREF
jgi:hypothetical protein